MEIKPVAFFRAPLTGKFGLPRQAGLAESLRGTVVLEPEFRNPEALRGLEDFDFLWLIWGFHLNKETSGDSMTVRPPRLGGNERVGVFASRSPYRPNRLGLSSVRVASIDVSKGEIHVLGADLADGTPVYDIKPYVAYADSFPEALCGFAAAAPEKKLTVVIPDTLPLDSRQRALLEDALALDPRPAYQNQAGKVYGMPFEGGELRFKVENNLLTVLSYTL